MMQKYTIFVGIDMSKEWFDAALYWLDLEGRQPEGQFKNDPKGFECFVKWVDKQLAVYQRRGPYYVCMEHTGIYSLALAYYLESRHIKIVMECPLRISRSMGLRRGKTDAADARAIAQYAQKSYRTIEVRPLPSPLLLHVQTLLSLRRRLIRYQHGLRVAAGELPGFIDATVAQSVGDYTQQVCQPIQERITLLDREIKQLLWSDEELKRLYKLVCSVVGVGPLITAYLLVYTNGFTAFRKSRQFCCYIGVVPFAHQSGQSVKRPDRVSYLSNKRIKALISTAAMVALQHDPQFKAFFKKHNERGKEDGWIYNVLKTKVIHRVFAVVKRGTPFVKLDQHLT